MSIIKNPMLRNAQNFSSDLASGNLLKEIKDNQLKTINGGGLGDLASKTMAGIAGLGSNYGKICTISAECDLTHLCGNTK